jgi:hypothetical protein
MRRALALAAALLALPDVGIAADGCFWVHGRLSAYNGTPTFRIWPIGTRRMLGVVDADGGSQSANVLPADIRARVMPDAFAVSLFGDFRVCPLAADRPGHMRAVQLRQARGLVVRRN